MDASARAELARLVQLLDAWGHTPDDVQALSTWVGSGCPALRSKLPPRYLAVLQDLLDRLQSSALFAEESCSFSQTGLLANLRGWADKAELALT